MVILITGSKGFLGSNLKISMKGIPNIDIFEYNLGDTQDLLIKYIESSDFIFHFAAKHRPLEEETYLGNIRLTKLIVSHLLNVKNKPPIIFSSSIQVERSNPYGRAKKEEEEILIEYSNKHKGNVYIFRLPNLYGTLSKPNYTSVVTTMIYNCILKQPLIINDPSTKLSFLFVDKIVKMMKDIVMGNNVNCDGIFVTIPETMNITLGYLTYLLGEIKNEVSYSNDLMVSLEQYNSLKYTYSYYESLNKEV